ncbi:Bax inhibitor-1/YccA family protein [Corynebacterium variabile]|uniref:Bax inhibitor-1/YccA family protein n=1 Tax=Corynebacterium variabile TaxID=1727 RepID=UPI002899C81F|nr:Bax inhibitor-1/YccA family protein [Corynebacterium variabile]
MKSSNPYMSSLTKATAESQRAQAMAHQGGYSQPGYAQNPYATQAQPGYQQSPNYGVPTKDADRPMTVDDVVTKTGITLAVIVVFAAITMVIGQSDASLAMGLTFVGAIGGFIAVLVSSFGKKYGSPVVTLVYAVFEGLFVGGFSWLLSGMAVGDSDAGAMIFQAILGTVGVFVGMLVVYKTGAIRVTPKFTKIMISALIGVCVLALGNLVLSLFSDGAGPLRDGGPIAIIFSLVCIGLAAMSFLVDFDQADQLIRAGAPSKMAWGVALGLAVTLVWLYTEILRLLSYLNND